MSREAHVRFWEGVGVQLLCATQLVVIGERHLLGILSKYVDYYNGTRTHLSLAKDAPEPRRCSRRARAGWWRCPAWEGSITNTSGERREPIGRISGRQGPMSSSKLDR